MSFALKWVPHGSPEYMQAVALRLHVLREPLGLNFSPEELAREADHFHLTAYLAESLVGCLVLVPLEAGEIKMRQVAVAPDWQGGRVGSEMVKEAERFARERGFKLMTLHARQNVVPFYSRLGYTTEGDVFEEVTIPHQKMLKRLTPN